MVLVGFLLYINIEKGLFVYFFQYNNEHSITLCQWTYITAFLWIPSLMHNHASYRGVVKTTWKLYIIHCQCLMKNILMRRMWVVIKICTTFAWYSSVHCHFNCLLLLCFSLLQVTMYMIYCDINDTMVNVTIGISVVVILIKTLHSIAKTLGERWLNIVPMFLSTLNLVSTH